MSKRSVASVILGLATLVLGSLQSLVAAPSDLGAAGTEGWCGTHEWGIEEALARHQANNQRLSRLVVTPSTPLGVQPQLGPVVNAQGDVVVIEDDGTLIADKNLFDYAERGVRFQRKGKSGFKVRNLGGSINTDLGERLPLTDDDSIRVDFPGFRVRFHGKRYSSVWINSDGNLTFNDGDNASTSRDLQRMLNGPPRISPFFADLNPEAATGDGGIYLRFSGNKMFVTWWNVPEFGNITRNTFQLVLNARGNADVRFAAMAAREGIVGVAPGGGSGLELLDLSRDLPLKRKGVAIAERFSDSESVDDAAVAQVFFDNFADDYDQLVMFADFNLILLDSFGTIAYHLTTRNTVRGIGIPNYDASRFFGSSGRLGGFVNMGRLSQYPDNLNRISILTFSPLDVLAHELGHQWLVRATFVNSSGQISEDLLGRGRSHWSFYTDSDASFLEGSEIRDNGDGTFTTLEKRAGFSPLDLYLMGMIPSGDVPGFFYIAAPGGPDSSVAAPEFGVSFVGQRVNLTIDRVVAALGLRQPSAASSPKNFKIGFILLTKDSRPAPAASVNKVQRFATEIKRVFRQNTRGIGTLDTSLTPR